MAPGSLIRRPKTSIHISEEGSMSAVSSGSPQGSAEVREPEASREPGPDRASQRAEQRNRTRSRARRTSAPTNGWWRSCTSGTWRIPVRWTGPGGASSPTTQPALPNGTGPQPVLDAPATAPATSPQVRRRQAAPAVAQAPAPRRPRRRPPRPPRRPRRPRACRRPHRPPPAPAAAGWPRLRPRPGRQPPAPPALPEHRGQQAARRRGPDRRQHDGEPGGAHGDQRPFGAGEAPRR